MSELASRFCVHPTMINQWKRALRGGASGVFERSRRKAPVIDEDQVRDLHAKIGELTVVNSFLERTQALGSEVTPVSPQRDTRPALTSCMGCRWNGQTRSGAWTSPICPHSADLALPNRLPGNGCAVGFWETGSLARAGVRKRMEFYNHRRPHKASGGQPPAMVYSLKVEATHPDQQEQIRAWKTPDPVQGMGGASTQVENRLPTLFLRSCVKPSRAIRKPCATRCQTTSAA